MEEMDMRIHKTEDYSIFKRLDGNRTSINNRKIKVIKAIKEVGYVPAPIIVNEKLEVIDGQARVEALKDLELPVYYIIIPGIGINECIAMNINQTGWSLIDYINSYAENGNVSYMYLQQLFKAYSGMFKTKVILYAVTDTSDGSNESIKKGHFVCTPESYNRAQKILSWLTEFKQPLSRLGGHTEYYYIALAYCYGDPEVDNDRILDKVTALQANLIPVVSTVQALEQLEDIYNNKARQRVYIATNYKKYLDNKYAWYSQKYGKADA